MLLSQNRKEYLEDSSLDSFNQKPEEIGQDQLRESSEYVDTLTSPQRYPILFVDVNLGEDRVERLTVLEGDTSREVAQKFWEEYGLNIKLRDKLQQMLDDQMNGILTRINEEEEQGPDYSPGE